jgi:hypothetical protein
MKRSVTSLMLVVLAAVAAAATSASYKGLEIEATGVERATRVSLQDCPPGENIVRGVIRPVEDNEFATISLAVNASKFEGGDVPKPLLYDDAGNEYKTAQSFRDVGSQESYTCTFAFRVPKGITVTKVVIEDATLDLAGLEK